MRVQQMGRTTTYFDRIAQAQMSARRVPNPHLAHKRVSIGAVANWAVIASALAYLVWHLVAAV